MTCPVCDETDVTVINVRIEQESDLTQAIGSAWDGRNMARCDNCGVLYDHQLATRESDGSSGERRESETVNCPSCGSPAPGDRDRCSYCDEPLRSPSR
ncbi:hypothetical protein [Haloterrigena alkaliphila]|uniref:Uncharacterized protein n=1 Tax=Haloterrigena alkaliphila TaxID=2816475 RepID=A0A8A2VAJ5_9EURY|nr:hypothetical protein [Haloterrigena alkaliphila]QSW98116.1 hypothetical protein J0X25_11915 [Haloterrigena alkaliphila]